MTGSQRCPSRLAIAVADVFSRWDTQVPPPEAIAENAEYRLQSYSPSPNTSVPPELLDELLSLLQRSDIDELLDEHLVAIEHPPQLVRVADVASIYRNPESPPKHSSPIREFMHGSVGPPLTRYIEEPNNANFKAMWSSLRRCAVRTLTTISVRERPPQRLKDLGIVTWQDFWSHDTALYDLVVDCYMSVIHERLPLWQSRATAHRNIDPWVERRARRFFKQSFGGATTSSESRASVQSTSRPPGAKEGERYAALVEFVTDRLSGEYRTAKRFFLYLAKWAKDPTSQPRTLNYSKIAKEVRVSPRTVERDLTSLRNIVIEYLEETGRDLRLIRRLRKAKGLKLASRRDHSPVGAPYREQLDSARGNAATEIPEDLARPDHWEK